MLIFAIAPLCRVGIIRSVEDNHNVKILVDQDTVVSVCAIDDAGFESVQQQRTQNRNNHKQ